MFFLKNVVEISKHCIHYFFIGQLLCLIYAARYDVDITSSKYKEWLHCDVLIFKLFKPNFGLHIFLLVQAVGSHSALDSS